MQTVTQLTTERTEMLIAASGSCVRIGFTYEQPIKRNHDWSSMRLGT